MVFHRDRRQDLAHRFVVHAVLLRVGGRHHREHGGRGQSARRPVVRRIHGVEALIPAVLDLLGADGHRDVVRSRGHRVDRAAQRLGAGRAVVLDPGHRLVVQLQRPGQSDPAHPALRRPEPIGVDIVLGDARRGERLRRRINDEIVEPLLPLLGELGAAHPDDGHFVADAVRTHQPSPSVRTGRAFQK